MHKLIATKNRTSLHPNSATYTPDGNRVSVTVYWCMWDQTTVMTREEARAHYASFRRSWGGVAGWGE